ncbi:tyrosine-type recombinase/integrase [Chloroflexota bacterium]
MAERSDMDGNINKSANSKELVVVPPKAVRAIRRGEYVRPVSFITESEVYRLADAAKAMRDGERNELLIVTMFQAALRVTEATKLRVKDKAMVDGKHILLVQGKGNKPRLVAIPEKLSYHLGDYAQRQGLKPEDRFFPITRVRAWQVITECADNAGIDRRVYCHLLRHGGAIARLKRTGNPKSLQIHLGHSDMNMTMRYLATMQTIESLQTESEVEFDR